MTPSVDIRREFGKKWARVLADYKKETVPAALRAMNRSMTSARQHSAVALRAAYGNGLKLGAIKARIKFTRATRGKPSAVLDYLGTRISLYGKFGMRTTRGKKKQFGVSFGRLPWRIETIGGVDVTPQMLQRAFRQRGGRGVAGVFSRLTKERESMTMLVAPGVARAIDELKIGDKTMAHWRARFHVEFERDLRYRIRRQAG